MNKLKVLEHRTKINVVFNKIERYIVCPENKNRNKESNFTR